MFGGCRFVIEDVLPRYGITSTLVDGTNLDAWREAVKPNTKVLFLETPANPTLEIIDLQAVAEIAHKAGARLIVDNVFATPVLQRPMEYGADIVVYSATKHIDGQGRCLGGVILVRREVPHRTSLPFIRNTGPSPEPLQRLGPAQGAGDAGPARARDVRTRGRHRRRARARAQGQSASSIPAAPITRKRRSRVRKWDSGGSLVTFEVDGGKAEAFRFANALKLIDISNNLGDAKTLITHPATTTHYPLDA